MTDKMEPVGLKPCPCCGSTNLDAGPGPIYCKSCWLRAADAERWNTRPAPVVEDGLVERLEDEADLCRNDGADDIAALLEEAATALRAQSKGEAERAVIVAFIRRHGDVADNYALSAEKGTTRRAVYGGAGYGCAKLADAIERGDHRALERSTK